jgi:hypothetical protein
MADTGQVAWQQFAHVPDRLVGDPGEDASGTAGIHPQQTSGRLPPHLSERLHSSDDEAPWNDRHGRDPAVQRLEAVPRQFHPFRHPERCSGAEAYDVADKWPIEESPGYERYAAPPAPEERVQRQQF